MAAISKTAAGKWRVRIHMTGWPVVCKTFRSRRDASDWARTAEDEMVRGLYSRRQESEHLLVCVALTRYLNEISSEKKARTHYNDRSLAKHLEDFFKGYAMTAVAVEQVSRYRDMRLKAGLANNSVRNEIALLRQVFNVAIQDWGISMPSNPVALTRKPRPGKPRARRLSADEEARLFDALAARVNPMVQWIARIALETAMRSTEITSLRRGQVDLVRRIVSLTDTKNGSSRVVPLTETAAKTLRVAMETSVRPIGTDLVFFGELGKKGERKPYVFKKAWQSALRQARIADLRFHDLRHEAISRLVEVGLSDQEVASISGHKSMQMLRRYTHLRNEDFVHKMDNLQRISTDSRRSA